MSELSYLSHVSFALAKYSVRSLGEKTYCSLYLCSSKMSSCNFFTSAERLISMGNTVPSPKTPHHNRTMFVRAVDEVRLDMCAERVSVFGNMRRVSVGLIPSRLFSSFDGFHFQSRDKMATFHVLTESTLWIHVNSFLPGVPTWTIEYERCHTEDKSDTANETSAMKSIPGTLPRLAVRQRDFETLKRLYYLNSQPQFRRIPMFWFQSVKHHAASEGNLELLQWLHEHATENCRSDTMANAARNGHVAVVRWLQRHCPESQTSMNSHVMDDAARSGLLDIVRVLHEERSEGCTTLAMDNAASNGHLEVVKYLHENRSEGCSSDGIDAAATNGHLGVLEWLLEHRSEHFTKNAPIGAASNGHLDVLRFLFCGIIKSARLTSWRRDFAWPSCMLPRKVTLLSCSSV